MFGTILLVFSRDGSLIFRKNGFCPDMTEKLLTRILDYKTDNLVHLWSLHSQLGILGFTLSEIKPKALKLLT